MDADEFGKKDPHCPGDTIDVALEDALATGQESPEPAETKLVNEHRCMRGFAGIKIEYRTNCETCHRVNFMRMVHAPYLLLRIAQANPEKVHLRWTG